MRCCPPIQVFATLSAIVGPSVALAQPAPDYDFQWSTIGNAGNAPYTSSDIDHANVNNHGRVDYEFRASRLEITTGQWVEFFNAMATLDDSPLYGHANTILPAHHGAGLGPVLPNGNRTLMIPSTIPDAAMRPVAGISWYDAARYCNWLHNNKEVSIAAISTGAYDTSTWGPDLVNGGFTDAHDRMPGATFFLPTLDEYLKATHYDPNRYGPGQGGYWQNKAQGDTPLTPGLPGSGQTSAGYQPGESPHPAWNIPLGAYPEVDSAYGLLDTSGGGREWLESFPDVPRVFVRPFAGSFAGSDPGVFRLDEIQGLNADSPDRAVQQVGFRIYSTVPSPGGVCVGALAMLAGGMGNFFRGCHHTAAALSGRVVRTRVRPGASSRSPPWARDCWRTAPCRATAVRSGSTLLQHRLSACASSPRGAGLPAPRMTTNLRAFTRMYTRRAQTRGTCADSPCIPAPAA